LKTLDDSFVLREGDYHVILEGKAGLSIIFKSTSTSLFTGGTLKKVKFEQFS
jgi:hypothetical protein